MSYRIITDTCCDFPEGMYEQLNISVVPLVVNFRGQSLAKYDDAFTKELFASLRSGDTATTSAANPDDWAKAIESCLCDGHDALVLTFSSGLSTTYQSAVIASQDLQEKYPARKIRVVDTRAASLGEGLLVWYTCQKRDEGLTLDELAAWVEEHKYNLCHWFTVDDLMCLKRGGRISAATAVLGSVLNIKPVLHMDDAGHLVNMSKVRGRKASIAALADKMAETALPGQNDTVFISHGDCIEDAQYLTQLLKERCGVKNVLIGYTGPVIGSHSGPGTLALFFLGKHR